MLERVAKAVVGAERAGVPNEVMRARFERARRELTKTGLLATKALTVTQEAVEAVPGYEARRQARMAGWLGAPPTLIATRPSASPRAMMAVP